MRNPTKQWQRSLKGGILQHFFIYFRFLKKWEGATERRTQIRQMAQNVKVCEIDPEVKEKLRKFRFRKEKNNAAISMKIDPQTMTIILDEEYEDCTLDDLQEELPGHLPRYLVYSYCLDHDDGRTSFPLVFIFISPAGCKPELQMMYAGTKTALVREAEMTKVFEVRNVDELTDEWLRGKLALFR
ncbi:PREDICTED: glia maturation factor gamma-like isoform X1 [Branchiostoma belcheri]|uniref:Glia maturation factor gamma-like isoform X1 n=1 Tax=Branchiostoma belcheri TaxID=7741 RepID=A0A6P4YVH1_BRABE|nr:PREDICTED: glia maturation factor gamma-like isoform X1 [Branchiostoma belcheri]